MLALAYALAYWVTFLATWAVLARRLGTLDTRRTIRSLVRIVVAGFLTFGIAFGTQALLVTYVTGGGPGNRLAVLVNVVVVSVVGLAVYLLAAWSFRISEIGDALRVVRRRARR